MKNNSANWRATWCSMAKKDVFHDVWLPLVLSYGQKYWKLFWHKKRGGCQTDKLFFPMFILFVCLFCFVSGKFLCAMFQDVPGCRNTLLVVAELHHVARASWIHSESSKPTSAHEGTIVSLKWSGVVPLFFHVFPLPRFCFMVCMVSLMLESWTSQQSLLGKRLKLFTTRSTFFAKYLRLTLGI